MLFDEKVVETYFDRYPKLEVLIGAGTISLKTARQILDIDRWLMDEMYQDLLLAGAVRGSGSNTFRATSELHEMLAKRRATK